MGCARGENCFMHGEMSTVSLSQPLLSEVICLPKREDLGGPRDQINTDLSVGGDE